MWRRRLAAVRRNLQNIKKTRRVADESVAGDAVDPAAPVPAPDGERRRWEGASVIGGIVAAPLSLLSCFCDAGGGTPVGGTWMSGEFVSVSEMNHLIVSDSMRYAILM